MCPILIAQKSDITFRFSGNDEIFLRLWNKVNYFLQFPLYPPNPIYLAGRMTPKEIKNTHSISITSHQG
jgi:hypothetical protein